MTAARLSPAANLLRNSRLFAIPAAIPLPAVEPSSEPESYSDSATTPYPTRAAIETPLASLNTGDWGLKRPLPLKTTKRSGTPVVRFQRGIDTPEHVVDFESAADHVITLRKYQELNLRVTVPAAKDNLRATLPGAQDNRISAFESALDNTAGQPASLPTHRASTSWVDESASERANRLPKHLQTALAEIEKERANLEHDETTRSHPTQPTPPTIAPFGEGLRRWRYSGPYLAGLNGLEFDAFLGTITRERRAAFRELVKEDLIETRALQRRLQALEDGQPRAATADMAEVTDEDVAEHMRYLRSEPSKFGPLIANFFDLADGPRPPPGTKDPWHYGRDTIATDLYRDSGPPRTHPSAGISYLKSQKSATNDPIKGPRLNAAPVAARLLKSKHHEHNKHIPFVGVAGFVVPKPRSTGQEPTWKWQPGKDGHKLVVTPSAATVSQAGKLEIQTQNKTDWVVENELALYLAEKPAPAREMERLPDSGSSQMPTLDRGARHPPRAAPEPNKDMSEELDALRNLYKGPQRQTAR